MVLFHRHDIDAEPSAKHVLGQHLIEANRISDNPTSSIKSLLRFFPVHIGVHRLDKGLPLLGLEPKTRFVCLKVCCSQFMRQSLAERRFADTIHTFNPHKTWRPVSLMEDVEEP